MLGDNSRVNSAIAGFREYDGAIRPYATILPKVSTVSPDPSASSNQVTPSVSSSIDAYILPRLNSVHFGVAGLFSRRHPAESKAAEAFFGEGSGPNKRAHVEDSPEEAGSFQSR